MELRNEINIELKSEPMNEMLGHPPSWLIRSGNGLVMVLLILAFALSWLISYPDEIIGEGTVTTSDPPIEISNQLYTQIKDITVKDGQKVIQNELLIEFDNQATPKDIEQASCFLEKLTEIKFDNRQILPEPTTSLQLGVFQEVWLSLDKSVEDWNNAIQSGVEKEQIESIEREISYRQQLQTISTRKIKLSESEYNFLVEELKTTEKLAEKRIIPNQSLSQEKRTANQAMQTVQSQKEQFIQNLIQINTLDRELVRIQHEQKLAFEQRKTKIKSIIATLQNKLSDWRKSSTLIAPISGKVIFNTLLQKRQFYKPGQASVVVVPIRSRYYAIASIPASGAGNVKSGQKAMFELSDYPKSEFGLLEGRLIYKTQIEKDGKYEVRICLPKQLVTTYGKRIPSKARLNGTIKIVTKEKRLLSRLLEKLTDLIK